MGFYQAGNGAILLGLGELSRGGKPDQSYNLFKKSAVTYKWKKGMLVRNCLDNVPLLSVQTL